MSAVRGRHAPVLVMTITPRAARRQPPARMEIPRLRRALSTLAEATDLREAPHTEPPLEPRLRALVAEQLGLDTDALARNVSLVDDLAADSLDLAELALALEDAFGICVPDETLAEVRTYGELVETMETMNRRQLAVHANRSASQEPPFAWVCLVRPSGDGGTLERAGWLTPYTLETVLDSALRAGPGARLEITVPATVGADRLRSLERQFVSLRDRDLEVRVRRDPNVPPAYPVVAA
jgi:acyl carrier protein